MRKVPPILVVVAFALLTLAACNTKPDAVSWQHKDDVLAILPQGAWLESSESLYDFTRDVIAKGTPMATPSEDLRALVTETYVLSGGWEQIFVTRIEHPDTRAAARDFRETSKEQLEDWKFTPYRMAPIGDMSQAFVPTSESISIQTGSFLAVRGTRSVHISAFNVDYTTPTQVNIEDMAEIAKAVLE